MATGERRYWNDDRRLLSSPKLEIAVNATAQRELCMRHCMEAFRERCAYFACRRSELFKMEDDRGQQTSK